MFGEPGPAGNEHPKEGTAASATDDKKKGGGFWAKHKVELIAASAGILVTIYLYMRSKKAATTGATPGMTAVPPGTGTADSGGGVGGGSSTGAGGTGGSHQKGGNPAGDNSDALSAIENGLEALYEQNSTNAAALASALSVTPHVQVQAAAPNAALTTGAAASGGYTPAAVKAANPDAPTNFAFTSIFSGSSGQTYYGVGNEDELKKALAAGYTQTNAQAAGVPGGTTKAKYVYKS